MRVRIFAAIYLLTLFGIACYVFRPTDWWPMWFEPAPPQIPVAQPKATPDHARLEEEARTKLAFVSLVDRLPTGKPITPAKPLSEDARKRWQDAEASFASEQDGRAELLKALHDKTRRFFVDSPGAGSQRSPRQDSSEDIMLDDFPYYEWSRQQPGQPADFPAAASELLARIQPENEFHVYHASGLRNFLHPGGFGYIKDRRQVAGYKSHGFRYLMQPMHEGKNWRIDHVLLIGILTQDHPVVYLTDKLPSMEQIRQDKVRPLDFFEEAGMPSLREGEDLFIVRKGDTLRMLGALRATKTCQQCHDAEIGDLLGAFSYTLRPATSGKAGD